MSTTVTTVQRTFAVLCTLLFVASCAGRNPGKVDDPIKLKNVSIAMEAGANDNRPARVELVRVPDARLIKDLIAIDASAWFAGEGEAFRSAHPKGVYDRWEPVPGLGSGPHKIKAKGKYAGVLFCETREPSPTFRVEREGDLEIVIDNAGCRIKPDKTRSFFGKLRRSKRVELSFVVPTGANRDRPVNIELVRVGDADLARDLTRLVGTTWFGEGGRAFRRAHPNALVDDWELVPGSAYGPFRIAVEHRSHGVLFCGSTAGSPLRVPWNRHVAVEIDNQGCRLSEGESIRRRWNPLTWGGWR